MWCSRAAALLSRSRSVLVISAGQKAPTAATPWTYRQIAGRYQSTAPEEVANEVEPASVDVGHGALPPASLVQTLFDARVHLGHKPGVWNPKNSHFIKGVRSGIHVIDLDKTEEAMNRALEVIRGIVQANGVILFVNARDRFDRATRHAAAACGEYSVTRKWVGGTLSNCHETLKGNRHPDLIIMMGLPVLQVALKEAYQFCIPTIGIVDTDCDASLVTIPVPGNDDSEAAINLYLKLFCSAIISEKEKIAAGK